MNLYISDLHFGHANVIKFDKRPFADTDEMDKCLIDLWNSRVFTEDDVYIIGDFCFKSGKTPDWYLRQLKGHKHLIVGNHDKITLDCENAAKYLESVDKMLHVSDGDKQICLCHYPLAEWYKSRHGSWLIYGHIHGDTGEEFQFMRNRDHALNAAACSNNYTPASINELIRNNDAFKKAHPVEGYLMVAKNKVTGEEFVFSCKDLEGDYEIRPATTEDRNRPRLENGFSLKKE